MRDHRLWALLAVGLVVHALIAWGNLADPYGRTPINDALYYWQWSGRIADGAWVGTEPFFSAPLYPYLLALLRLAGLGIEGVAILQLVVHIATAGLLARVGRLLFDRRAGLLAAALWLGCTDAAAAHGRLLAGTLQTFLVALVLEGCVVFWQRRGRRGALRLGLSIGLAALAWPALLPAAVLLAGWALWLGARARGAALILSGAALGIAPATLHNYLAADAFIPISAHAGITFWHGNNPTANGVFAPYEVSSVKSKHAEDALARTRIALGNGAGWGDVSGYFLRRGLAWWRAEPLRALRLGLLKAWLFLSARNYGDMYLPGLERRAGLWPALYLAPLPVAWLALPALVAAWLLLRRDPRRHAPVVLLLLLPFAICTVFWYSPRYRLPAVPAMCLVLGWALPTLWAQRGRPLLLAGGLALALLSGFINRAVGVDASGELLTEVEARAAVLALGQGDPARAADLWERVLARDPFHPVREQLAWMRATHPDAALRDGTRALELARAMDDESGGKDPRRLGLLAAALAETGDFAAAHDAAMRASILARSVGNSGAAATYADWADQFARREPLRVAPRVEPAE